MYVFHHDYSGSGNKVEAWKVQFDNGKNRGGSYYDFIVFVCTYEYFTIKTSSFRILRKNKSTILVEVKKSTSI